MVGALLFSETLVLLLRFQPMLAREANLCPSAH
jgi:hypothetical protein